MSTEPMTTQPVSPDGRWRWDGTAWVPNVESGLHVKPAPMSEAKKGLLVVGIVGLIVAGGVIAGATQDRTPQAVKDLAGEIAVDCFNRVQPVNFPRISPVEEQYIRACARGSLESNYVPADIKDEVRAYLEAEYLPDGR